jgi:lauroyl/myristoyl acyltransferase
VASAPPEVVASDESPRWYSHAYNRARYYRLARLVASGLPRPARRRVAAGLAGLAAARFHEEQAAVKRNLARVHPDRDAVWLESAVQRVFANFAVCFADLLSLNRGPASTLLREVVGIDEQVPTREALARGRGCVSITGHLGNWELAGRLLTRLGRRVHVVMAPEADPGVASLLGSGDTNGLGGSFRVVRLTSPLVGVELGAALRRGEVVAFQIDRGLGGRSDCRVPFFGSPAAFPLGPVAIAAAAGAPIVPAFCVLDQGGRYRVLVEPAFEVRRGEEAAGMDRAVGVLERYVKAYWDQWFNFYDVWTPESGQ